MTGKVSADRLREARVYLGFNRDDVSGAMGRERRWVDDIEHGRQKITGEELRELSRLYCRPVEWLCGESTFQPSPEMLRQLENPRLTDGDREAVLDFAEFLAGAGKPPIPRRCKHCRHLVVLCREQPPPHKLEPLVSCKGWRHVDGHYCDGSNRLSPIAEPADVRPSPSGDTGKEAGDEY